MATPIKPPLRYRIMFFIAKRLGYNMTIQTIPIKVVTLVKMGRVYD